MLSSILVIVLFSFMNNVICHRESVYELTKDDFEAIIKFLAEDSDFDNDITADDLARSFTFPGTKWCGPGDVAEYKEQLGFFNDTDTCCHVHDSCDFVIASGEHKYNLINDSKFTRLHCDCDEKFRKCLRDVNSKVSKIIGYTYFNVIGTQCFKEDWPILRCKKKGGWTNQKCVEYEFEDGPNKLYSWFDVPNF